MQNNKIIALLLMNLAITGCGGKTSEEHYSTALSQVENGRISEATISLKNALKIEPDNYAAREALANLYFNEGSFTLAEKEIVYLDKQGKLTEPLFVLLTQTYSLLNDYEAVNFMEPTFEWRDQNLKNKYNYHRAVSYFKLNDLNNANEVMAGVAAGDTSNVYTALAAAYLKLNGKVAEAKNDLLNLRASHPNNIDILMLLALTHRLNGQLAEAEQVFSDVLDVMPKFTMAKIYLANLLINNGKFEEAEKPVTELKKNFPSSPLITQLAANLAMKNERFDEALLHYEYTLQNGIDTHSNRMLAGIAAFKVEKFEVAHKYLSSIEKQLPNGHPARKILIMTQLQLGYVLTATQEIEGIKNIDESDVSMITEASYQLAQSGNYDKARTLLNKIDSDQLNAPANLVQTGILKLSLKDAEGLVDVEKAISLDPNLPYAKSILAAAYLSANEYEKAMELANSWKGEGNATGYSLAGQVHFLKGEVELANNAFNKVLSIDEFNGPALMYFAKQSIENGQFEAAIKNLEKIFEKQPSDATAIKEYYKANKALGAEEVALSYLNNLVERDSDNLDNRLLLAQFYISEGKPNEVIRVLTDVNVKPSSATNSFYWLALLDSYITIRSSQDALNVAKDWVKTKPNNILARLKKSNLEANLGDNASALKTVQNALILSPNDKSLRISEINLLTQTNQLDEAQKKLDQYFGSEKNVPAIETLQGLIYLNRKEFANAVPPLVKFYERVGSSENARYVYAAYNGMNKPEKADSFIAKHLESNPDDVSVLVMLANIYFDKDEAKSLNYFERVVSLVPKNLMALNNLAYLQKSQNQLQAAKATIDKALAIYDKHPSILDTAATIYEENGDIKTAKQFIQSAYDANPKSETIKENYRRIMRK